VHLLPWRLHRLPHRPAIAVTYHDLQVPYLFPKAGPLRWQAVLALARWSDAAVVTNEGDRRTLSRYPWLADRLAVIPIGSNIAARPPFGFDRDTWRARYGLAADDLLLAYFGFLNPTKGGETLVRALHRLTLDPPAGRTTHLLLIGGQVGSSDPTNRAYLQQIEALIDRLGLSTRVHRTGYVSTDQVSAHLLAADACVLPYEDGASFRRGSLMAALAHGRPIVTTHPRVPLPQLRDGENVLLAPPGDPGALAASVARLAADPALSRRLGQGAAALAQQFTWQRIAARTGELFDRLKTKNRV
jgi:glycosyltransferase involved in cell wall biosynthesis